MPSEHVSSVLSKSVVKSLRGESSKSSSVMDAQAVAGEGGFHCC